jgi:hypothetical protein
VLVRVVALHGEPPPTVTVELAEAPAASGLPPGLELPLVPLAPGLALAQLDPHATARALGAAGGPAPAPLIVRAGAARVRLAPRDPEHAALGIDPAVAALARPAPVLIATRPTHAIVPLIAFSIAMLLAALRTRARRGGAHQR